MILITKGITARIPTFGNSSYDIFSQIRKYTPHNINIMMNLGTTKEYIE